jgi:large subunit ribosomal protein L20
MALGVEQYADRKILKRDMRSLWIQRINAGTREHGLKYGDFIHGQKLANVALDRKILADLAITEPYSFKSVVDIARDALMKKKQAELS